jgi:hypothetical protein
MSTSDEVFIFFTLEYDVNMNCSDLKVRILQLK